MTHKSTRPLLLTDNRVPVYYAGGRNITAFRAGEDVGEPAGGQPDPGGATGPEDWVGSLTALPAAMIPPGAAPDTGVSRTSQGSLGALVERDPVGWLGPELAQAFGGRSGLLVKILDAGERLPVHAHPNRAFAQAHLGSVFGKTEGWIVMRAEPGARVWLGMRDTLDPAELRRLVDDADIAGMLAAMNEITVAVGDVFYVPAGLPHAIGPGVMVTELQEPTSFSVLADHAAFGVDAAAATLGLGWDLALDCFDLAGYRKRLAALRPSPRVIQDGPAGQLLDAFPAGSEVFFRALLVTVRDTLVLPEASFAILVVTEGTGEIHDRHGTVHVRQGQTVVVPHATGALEIVGQLRLIACLPPRV